MDPSKAFDTIDHEILITKMEHYGIKNLESQWFKSYLSVRKQYVEFNNTQSATEIITVEPLLYDHSQNHIDVVV